MNRNYDRTKTHYLSEQKLKQYKQRQQSGHIVNPYQKNGIYWAFVESLIKLGVNKMHSFLDVKQKMKQVLGENRWNKFQNKIPRNQKTAKDVNGRLMQNAIILQRVSGAHPYGKKMQQLGMVINIYRGQDDLPIYQLQTGLVKNARPSYMYKYCSIKLK